jgi:hypothetical protein
LKMKEGLAKSKKHPTINKMTNNKSRRGGVVDRIVRENKKTDFEV